MLKALVSQLLRGAGARKGVKLSVGGTALSPAGGEPPGPPRRWEDFRLGGAPLEGRRTARRSLPHPPCSGVLGVEVQALRAGCCEKPDRTGVLTLGRRVSGAGRPSQPCSSQDRYRAVCHPGPVM